MDGKDNVNSAKQWYHPDREDVFSGRYSGVAEFLTLRTQLDLGSTEEDGEEQPRVTIQFLDQNDEKLFEVQPDVDPISGEYFGQSRLVSSKDGEDIVVMAQRASAPSQMKIKTPGMERLFQVQQRKHNGEVQGHHAGVEVMYASKLRFWLSRNSFDPYDDPTYAFTDAESDAELGTARLMPCDVITTNDVTTLTVTYEINIPEGGDAALCALFAYLIHWAELRNIGRHFDKSVRTSKTWAVENLSKRLRGELPQHTVEAPEGLSVIRDAIVEQGLRGRAHVGLDLIGGPCTHSR